MTLPREELIAFSRNERTLEQIVRLLLETRTWYAPIGFAVGKLNRQSFSNTMIYPVNQSELDPGRMVFFTDKEAAAAANLPLVMVGDLDGVDLFDALDPQEYARLDINYGLPREQTFYLGADAFNLVKLWSKSIRLEQQLASKEVSVANLKDHPGYLVAVRAENNHWYPANVNGIGEPCALAFTAPDRFNGFLQLLDPAEQQQVKAVTVAGSNLFASVVRSGLGGVLFNHGGREPITIYGAILEQLAAA